MKYKAEDIFSEEFIKRETHIHFIDCLSGTIATIATIAIVAVAVAIHAKIGVLG